MSTPIEHIMASAMKSAREHGRAPHVTARLLEEFDPITDCPDGLLRQHLFTMTLVWYDVKWFHPDVPRKVVDQVTRDQQRRMMFTDRVLVECAAYLADREPDWRHAVHTLAEQRAEIDALPFLEVRTRGILEAWSRATHHLLTELLHVRDALRLVEEKHRKGGPMLFPGGHPVLDSCVLYLTRWVQETQFEPGAPATGKQGAVPKSRKGHQEQAHALYRTWETRALAYVEEAFPVLAALHDLDERVLREPEPSP